MTSEPSISTQKVVISKAVNNVISTTDTVVITQLLFFYCCSSISLNKSYRPNVMVEIVVTMMKPRVIIIISAAFFGVCPQVKASF